MIAPSRLDKRAVGAWVLYDWSYGAFTTIVSTFVFATYFTQAVASDPVTGAAQWASAQSLAGVLIALLSVPLGAIADAGGRRRLMLGIATWIMIAGTLALYAIRPHGRVTLALSLVIVATVAFEVATVFYNAMLPDIAPARSIGRLSGLGWGAGYAGGIVCLVLCLTLLISPDPPLFGLDRATAEPIRATVLLAGVWVALFSWPAMVFVPESGARQPWGQAAREGLAAFVASVKAAAAEPDLRLFLIARLCYIDGLNTLFAFGGIYAAGQFGLDTHDVLVFGIGLNITAGIGAAAFAFVEDRIGAKAVILVCVSALAALGAALLVIDSRSAFWVLGLSLGVFVGPAQAASRSFMARIAPAERRAAFFGLFALSGRVTAFAGPFLLGVLTAAFHSQRAGMAVIVVFLVAGAALMAFVPSPPSDR